MPRSIVVLCVGDEPTILLLRRLLLSVADYRVISANNFDSALRLFAFNEVDLVITSNKLGEHSGVELCWEMKWFKPEVPLVLLIGFKDPPRASEPVDLVLALNMTPPAFLEAIARLLSERAVENGAKH